MSTFDYCDEFWCHKIILQKITHIFISIVTLKKGHAFHILIKCILRSFDVHKFKVRIDAEMNKEELHGVVIKKSASWSICPCGMQSGTQCAFEMPE